MIDGLAFDVGVRIREFPSFKEEDSSAPPVCEFQATTGFLGGKAAEKLVDGLLGK